MTRTFVRPTIERAGGYVPGEQPDAADVIKLNTNENPYPPAPAVNETLQSFDINRLRRYPQPTALDFRQIAARIHGVSPDAILATNGGDELLRLAISTFVEPGQRIGYANPSYSLYPVLAELHGAEVFDVDLNDDWSLPADFAQQMNAADVKVTFLVNPHAPSGRLLPPAEVAELAQALDGVLFLDEAYVDFVSPELGHSAVHLVEDFDNVLILRTLSKGYSLAGLRFGYGIGALSLIEPMQTKTKDSYNKDALGQALASAALEAQDYAQQTWRKVRQERVRLTNELTARGFDVGESHSNFVLATLDRTSNHRASALYEGLKARNILVRYFSDKRLENSLRISVGTPDENDALLHALDGLMGR